MLRLLDRIILWRDRADEARAQAEQLKDPAARAALEGIADSYDRLAEMAEKNVKKSASA